MRYTGVAKLVVLFGLGALGAPLACDDGSTSSAPPVPDAGLELDAGGGSPDADVPDAPPATDVTVTVRASGAAAAGVRVLSQDADGAVLAESPTDASGVVRFETAPNMITVVTTSEAGPRFVTYLGVAGGDRLVVDAAAVSDDVVSFATYQVSIAAPFAGATGYSAHTGECSGYATGGPISLPLYRECVRSTNAVLVIAEGGEEAIGFGFAKNLATPADDADVNVGPVTLTAPGSFGLQVNGVTQADAPSIYVSALAHDAPFTLPTSTGSVESGLTYAVPTGFAEAYRVLVSRSEAGQELRAIAARVPGSASSTTLDFATVLPRITSDAVDTTTPHRPQVTIGVDGSVADVDVGIVGLAWLTDEVDEASARWTFMLPPGTTTFRAPALPADLAALAPQAASTVIVVSGFVEATQLPSYAAAKALAVDPSEPALLLDRVGTALPTDGTARLTVRRPQPL